MALLEKEPTLKLLHLPAPGAINNASFVVLSFAFLHKHLPPSLLKTTQHNVALNRSCRVLLLGLQLVTQLA